MGQLKWLVTALCGLVVLATPNVQANDEAAIQAFLRAYADAFNRQDLEAVSAMWTENGVHVDRETGERTEGRTAIRGDLAEVFQRADKPRLEGTVERVWFIKSDLASVEGTTTVTFGDAQPAVAHFSAIIVKDGDIWSLGSAEEQPVEQSTTASEVLQDLDWLVGTWIDESATPPVISTVRWSSSGNFLLRSFFHQTDEDQEPLGSQVIGWDPRSRQIRSWTFNADGSFGDGVWTKAGSDWLIHATQTLLDGGAAAGTYVITPLDDNTLTLRLVGQEIDGAPVPASEPSTLVRVPESDQSASDESKSAQ